MGDHGVEIVVSRPGGIWLAMCRCGWHTPDMTSPGLAELAVEMHCSLTTYVPVAAAGSMF
jgi:hypothetical protein